MSLFTDHPVMTAVILAAVAVGVAFVGWSARRHRHALLDTPTLTCAELADATTGSGSVVAEVIGRTRPGSGGPLSGPYSTSPCVWYRTQVTRHYRKRVRNGKNGGYRTRNATETVEEYQSHEPFEIHDATGRVVFDPAGVRTDAPVKSHQRFVRGNRRRGGRRRAKATTAIGKAATEVAEVFGDGSGTTGYTYREWILRPDQKVFALAQAQADGRNLLLRRPDDSPFMLSTRSEAELMKSAWLRQCCCFAGAAALVVFAMGVLVYDML